MKRKQIDSIIEKQINETLKGKRIISPITWRDFSQIVKYILQNEDVQKIIEEDRAFATQLRKMIKKLEDDFYQI